MPRKTLWTEGQDSQIRRLRTEGASWDMIALLLGLPDDEVRDRARQLGVERRPAHAAIALDESERAPLPPGHAESWGAINRGTVLDGTRFRPPGTLR